jgi:hypothetical protein
MNKILTNCLSGVYGILQDTSSTFALITLIGVLVVTFLKPVLGGIALAAFCTAVPGILAYCSHKVTLAQMVNSTPPASSQTTVLTNNDLPPQGIL